MIILSFFFSYGSNADIQVSINGIDAGVSDLSVCIDRPYNVMIYVNKIVPNILMYRKTINLHNVYRETYII